MTDTTTPTRQPAPNSELARLRTALLEDDGSPAIVDTAWALVEALEAALHLEPCHTTGNHDPHHTPRLVCQLQTLDVVNRLFPVLGYQHSDELPRRLHDETCPSCHDPGSREEPRARVRDLHEWAGVPVPDEVAEPGVDAARPGDDDLVLARLIEHGEPNAHGWIPVGVVSGHAVALFGDVFSARFTKALYSLNAAHRIQWDDSLKQVLILPAGRS